MEGRQEVLLYEKTRYSKPDQRLVDRRERQIVKRILKRIDPRSPGILDIPCGYGRLTPLLLKQGLFLTCSDLSKAMVDRCREKVTTDRTEQNRGLCTKSCGFVVCDIRKLPFKENSFDCTFTLRLVQHVSSTKERRKLFLELSRVTSKWAIISFYRRSLVHILERKITGLKRGINMLSQEGFAREAESCNLRVRGAYSILPVFHAQVIALLEKSENLPPELFQSTPYLTKRNPEGQ